MACDRYMKNLPDAGDPVKDVRDLGVYFDTHLTIKAHIARVSRTLLLSSPPSAFDQGLSWARGDCSTGVCLHHLSAGLLQLCPSQTATVNRGTPAESPQRRSPSGNEPGTSLSLDCGPA